MGLFQSGKSTLINSLLSCIAATMGEGLRTSHMAVSYRFGDADWAVGYGADGEQFETTLAEFLAAPEKSPWEKSQSKADVFLHRPILRDVVLVDTPGFDYSDEDNQTATVAADEADGIALLVTKQLPLDNKPLCGFLHRNLHEKPFAVIINCGKDGPHLADSNSIAAARVESAVLLALDKSWYAT
jgi:hypothetical protein